MRVLFISTTGEKARFYGDASVRYRCYNPAEEFRRTGVLADVTSFEGYKACHEGCYDVFVFHRPPKSPKLYDSLERLAAAGKRVLADYDDLTFDPRHALASSIYVSGRCSREQTLAIFDRNHEAMRRFERFTVSTEPLRDSLLELHPGAKVEVIHNALPASVIRKAALIRRKPCTGIESRIISYLSGSQSHDRDWLMVEDVLARVSWMSDGFRVMAVGPLKIEHKKFKHNSVLHLPKVDYAAFLRRMATADVNIAPLHDSPFNSRKSGLKFFESGIVGIPTIASPIPDFQRFSGSPGLILADSPGQWEDAILSMFDGNRYAAATRGLAGFCASNCSAAEQAARMLGFMNV